MNVRHTVCLIPGYVFDNPIYIIRNTCENIRIPPCTRCHFIRPNSGKGVASLSSTQKVNTIADVGMFPFTVSINLKVNDSHLHLCSAAIINEDWVLTTATCTINRLPENLTVLAGTNVVNETTTNGTYYDVTTVITHPEYNTTDFKNNIALIKVKDALTFNDLIQPIELEKTIKHSFILISWGLSTKTDLTNQLQFIPQVALTEDQCTELSEGGDLVFDLGPGEVYSHNTYPRDNCMVDLGGGPVVEVFNNTLAGLWSYEVVRSCAWTYPNVFTSFPYYIDWINRNIARN